MRCYMTVWLFTLALLIAPAAWAEKVADPAERAEHIAALIETLDADPTDIAACMDYAENAALDMSFDAALAVVERCLVEHPSDAELIAQKARLLVWARRGREAEGLCLSYMSTHPDAVEVELELLLVRTRMPGDMRPCFERADELERAGFDDHPALLHVMARLHGRFGNVELASSAYRDCLTADPLQPGTLLDAAAFEASRAQRPDRALAYLRQAAMINPDLPIWDMIGSIAMTIGLADEAIASLEQDLAHGGNDANTYNILASVYTRTMDHPGALRVVERGLEANPDHLQLLLTHSAVLLELDRAEPFHAAVARLKEVAPDHPGAYQNLAIFQARHGDFASATESAREALNRNPGDRRLLRMVQDFDRAQTNEVAARGIQASLAPDEVGFDAAVSGYYRAVGDKSYPEAAFSASVALRFAEEPRQSAEALTLRATAYSYLGWTEIAVVDLDAALEHDPGYLPAMIELAPLISGIPDRQEEAVLLARRAYAQAPHNTLALGRLAGVLIDTGQFEEARALLESADTGRGAPSDLLTIWSYLHEAQGEYDTAADYLAQVDETGTLTRPGLERWTDILVAAGRYAEAESISRRIAERWPNEVNALLQLAYLQVVLGQLDDARENINRTVHLEPRGYIHLRVWVTAMVLPPTHGIDVALRHFDALQQQVRALADLDQTVMWCLLLEGRYAEAQLRADRWLENALPEHAGTGCDIPLRVMALRASGDEPSARSILTDPLLQERAQHAGVRAWIRTQEGRPGEFLPPEELDEDQQEQAGQLLPFFLAMEAWLKGDAESFTAHLSELRRNQFRAASIGQQLIIAYLAREYWPEDSD